MKRGENYILRREPTPLDKQHVIRPNRDTLYSTAVFDLDAGPVTVTMPDAGKRFMSMQIIDEDQYAPAVYYGAGSHTPTKKEIGTRYVLVAVRTLVDPSDPKDVEQAHALQDDIRVDHKDTGKFEVPNWDDATRLKVRGALLTLAEGMNSKLDMARCALTKRSRGPDAASIAHSSFDTIGQRKPRPAQFRKQRSVIWPALGPLSMIPSPSCDSLSAMMAMAASKAPKFPGR